MGSWLVIGFAVFLGLAAYWSYEKGFENSELRNRATDAEERSAALLRANEREKAERTAREKAEKRAEALELEGADRADRARTNRENREGCSDVCFVLDWE